MLNADLSSTPPLIIEDLNAPEPEYATNSTCCNCSNELKKINEQITRISKSSSKQLIGLSKISEHLQLDIDTEDLNIFPIMSDEDLILLERKLTEKHFQLQVVN